MDCSIGLPSWETSDAPIFDQWPDWWTSSLRDSRASPTASPGPAWERLTTATCGRTRSEPLGRWDPGSQSVKTCQGSLLTGTPEPWSGSFPKSGMTVAGALYPPPKSAHRTGGLGGGALRIEQGYVPTPTASNRPNRANALPRKSLVDLAQEGEVMFPTPLTTDAPDHGGPPNKNANTKQGLWPTPRATDGAKGGSPTNDNLPAEVKRWPTPAVRDSKDSGTEPSQWVRHTPGLSIQVQQQWPTPTVNGNHNRKGASPTSGDGLATAVNMFPTPVAADSDRTSDTYPRGNPTLLGAATWPTPMAHDGKRNRVTTTGEMKRDNPHLWAVVQSEEQANWPTPRASRAGGADSHGQMPEAFRGGLLNPRWVEWLQGIPIGWTETDELPQTNYTAWQTLSAMQVDLLPEKETKREMGRDVQAPTLLRFQLCGICTWPEHARGRPETSAADDPANQLPMREYIQPSKTPHRRESSEQRGRQSGGALPEMSHGCPHEHRDMGSWWEVEPAIPRVIGGHPNRVNQVRTLGNGIVPAVVARFLRESMA